MGEKKKLPNPEEGVLAEAFRWHPEHLIADHARNSSRVCLYDTPEELKPWLGEKCCFRLDEIEHRLYNEVDGLLVVGQITPITIYLTPKGGGCVVDGYLRHAAFLLAFVRGVANEIPGGSTILCTSISAPDGSIAGWHQIARRNFAENHGHKRLTPIDRASYARFLTNADPFGIGLTREAAAMEMGVSLSFIDKLLRLLALHPSMILQVHEGKLGVGKALAKGSRRGEAGAMGERPGTKHSQIRSALVARDWRPAPTHGLTPDEICQLFESVAPLKTAAANEIPEAVQVWHDFFSLSAEEAQALRPRRKRGRKKKTAIAEPPAPAPKKKRKKRAPQSARDPSAALAATS